MTFREAAAMGTQMADLPKSYGLSPHFGGDRAAKAKK
jgi:hypothetical protein